jgi:thiamine kinase-like enzyme
LCCIPCQSGVQADQHPAIVRIYNEFPFTEKWVKALGGHLWPIVTQHGDFAPWNLICQDNKIYAVDWEDGCLDGFPYFDIVHYIIQVAQLIYHWPAKQTRIYILACLQNFGLSFVHADVILRLAAIDSRRRFMNDTPEGAYNSLRNELAVL